MLQNYGSFADMALAGLAQPLISLSIFGATLDEISQTSSAVTMPVNTSMV